MDKRSRVLGADQGTRQLRAQVDQLRQGGGGIPTQGPARLLVGATGGGQVEVGGWITPTRILHASNIGNGVVFNGDNARNRVRVYPPEPPKEP